MKELEVALEGGHLEPWALVFDQPHPEHERSREALCALGNGRFATRGSACERLGSDARHDPGTYLSGLYDRLESTVDGKTFAYEELVNLPSWLPLRVLGPDGAAFEPAAEDPSFCQRLDLQRGLLERRVLLLDARGRRLRMCEQRLVSRRESALALQRVSLLAEGWSGAITVECCTDARVANVNASAHQGQDGEHLAHIDGASDGRESYWLRARTRGSRIEVVLATRVRSPAQESAPLEEDRRCGLTLSLSLTDARPVWVEKCVAITTSRDPACHEPLTQAQRVLARAPSFERAQAAEARLWRCTWDEFVLEAPAQPAITAVLRLHAFHLLQSVPEERDGLDASIGARGLHGENYRGHVFWDELFVMGVLNLRWPQRVRSLLLYRYRRLPEARAAARALGLRGAAFPWRSASDGREVTEPYRRNGRTGRWIPDHTHRERHIGAAIAYNVWRYYEVSCDREFMIDYGAELLLSIAQLWSSAAELDAQDGRYHLRGVVGPDEFHQALPDAAEPGLPDNAYTNVMAVWCLLRALDACAMLPASRRAYLLEELGIDDGELRRWEVLSRRMCVPFHDGGVISQFAGFERLAPFDWQRYRERYGDLERLDDILDAEGDSVDRYQVCKQPDVLMLFYLLAEPELRALFERLGYALPPETFARNFAYYRERTSDGSTLSRVVSAWIATRLDRAHSFETLQEALGVDLTTLHKGAANEGIHLGSMAGTIDVFQRAYLGIEAHLDRLDIDPLLPRELSSLRASICYRAQWLDLHADLDTLRVSARAEGTQAVTVAIAGERHELAPGASLERPLRGGSAPER